MTFNSRKKGDSEVTKHKSHDHPLTAKLRPRCSKHRTSNDSNSVFPHP